MLDGALALQKNENLKRGLRRTAAEVAENRREPETLWSALRLTALVQDSILTWCFAPPMRAPLVVA